MSEMRQKRSFTVGLKHDIQGAYESPLSGRLAKTVSDPKRTFASIGYTHISYAPQAKRKLQTIVMNRAEGT